MTPILSLSPLLQAAVAVMPAPWWGVPIIAGSFLVIGAVLGYVSNSLQDTKKAKREQLRRWDQNVLDHTSRVILLTIQFIQDSGDHRRAVEIKPGEPLSSPISETTLSKLLATYESLSSELVSMRLVTTAEVRAQVNEVRDNSFLLLMATNVEQMHEDSTRLTKSLDALESTVRKHFGIS
ncbi:hypothetical protein E3O62_02505 [Cryobacterium sp. TMT2-15-1]|uniref:hypothetical protein n=1 Tax=Cryobacterium sp. TMT2-15-1 TaxID=1259246 RepID=UPI001069F642|nr:hypothetical protein [Cryobacterium sp. TMT2-15-1]TFC63718.1 hypothetical protein E3O62_02505 [Cryobacterium sp. TMT2-15-1]